MGFDGKYGRVEFPDSDWVTIEDDEPVMVFRARDNLMPDIMKYYWQRSLANGAPAHHLRLIEEQLKRVKDWQQTHTIQDATSDTWLQHQTTSPKSETTEDSQDDTSEEIHHQDSPQSYQNGG
jgi:hypothetical protein